jgi:hypothetical protein
MLDLFSVEKTLQFDGGLSVCFRLPNAEETIIADDLADRLTEAQDSKNTAVAKQLLLHEIPDFLSKLAKSVTGPDGHTHSVDVEERLRASGHISGVGAPAVMNRLCFRSRLLADEGGSK